MTNGNLLAGSKTLPRTPQRQLNPKCGGEQDIDFSGLDFLQIARGNFSALRQLILRHFFTHPLPAHAGTEDLNPLPLFFGNWHDILHRFLVVEMNDTYIVKSFEISFDSQLRTLLKIPAGFNSGSL